MVYTYSVLFIIVVWHYGSSMNSGPLVTYNQICAPNTQYCFQAFANKVTYQEAWYDCHSRDMFLAMPKTQEEIDFIRNDILGTSAHDPVWIGLTDILTEGDWRWLDRTQLNTTTIQPWKTGRNDEPFDSKGYDEDCVEIQQKGWNNAVCTNNRPYLCQKYHSHCSSSSPYRYQNFCFKLFIGQYYTYDNSKSKCITDGGYLAMPKTSDVNQYINEINFGDEELWLGLYAVINRGFHWVDGDSLAYNTDVLPQVATSAERFVYIGNDGNWYLDLRIAEKSVICMYEETIIKTPQTYNLSSITTSAANTSSTKSQIDINGYCPCSQTDGKSAAELLRELLVDRLSVSKIKRRHSCAPDDRLSAKCIGVTGVFVIFCVCFVIVLNDLLNVFNLGVFIIKSKKKMCKKDREEEKAWEKIVRNLFDNKL